MWDKTLIESGRVRKQKWWMFPVSFFLHAFAIGLIIGISYWAVDAIQPPTIPVTLYSAPPPPPPPAPAATQKKEAPKEVEKAEPLKELQPTQIPEQMEEMKPSDQETVSEGTPEGLETGMEGGMEGGVDGGVPGGVFGGVPGGLIGGIPGGIGDEVPMEITAEMMEPKLIKKVEPFYPETARKAKIQGVVVLQAVITKIGTVEEVKVIRSLHPLLDQAAIQAVKQWKYSPATLHGNPVKVYFKLTVNFRLT